MSKSYLTPHSRVVWPDNNTATLNNILLELKQYCQAQNFKRKPGKPLKRFKKVKAVMQNNVISPPEGSTETSSVVEGEHQSWSSDMQIGLRSIIRSLDNSPDTIDCVLIDRQALRPPAIAHFIGIAAINSNKPCIAVPGLSSTLAPALGLRSARAIAFKCPTNPALQPLINSCAQLNTAVVQNNCFNKSRKRKSTSDEFTLPSLVVLPSKNE